ncbi:MAG TPA: hypothetical protein VG738_17305 [Chitinophagaceae bacterium]|nr:hypothetical protein [Chitinophagaceae bacterium]
MKKIIPLYLLSLVANTCFAQDVKINIPFQSIRSKFILMGELGKPFGTPLTVKGIVVNYFSKRGDDGPNIIVQSINDSAIQSFIQIPIKDFLGKVTDDPIANLIYGATYRFKVYETAGFIGIPYKMYSEEPFVKITAAPDTANGMTEVVVPGYIPQSSGFNFQNELIAKYGEKIEPIKWSPVQFMDRNALLSGIARNEGDIPVIQNTAWKLQLVGCRKWADAAVGKLAEVYGKVSETAIQSTYITQVVSYVK